MKPSTLKFQSLAAWGNGIFGSEPFQCHILESENALQQSGVLEELSGKQVSPTVFSAIDFRKQSLLTFSWPDLNGQTIQVTMVEKTSDGLRIQVKVQAPQEPAPQFGMNSILVQALVVNAHPLPDSIFFQVNGQDAHFQIHRP